MKSVKKLEPSQFFIEMAPVKRTFLEKIHQNGLKISGLFTKSVSVRVFKKAIIADFW